MANNRKPLSSTEIKELVRTHLGKDYNTTSPKGKALSAVASYVSYTGDVASLAELIPKVNTFIGQNRLLSVVAGHAGFISIMLFPAGAMINVINAYETGHRFYAYRAIAYTTTAWAFNRPIPTESSRVLRNIQTGWPTQPKTTISEYNKIWKETSAKVLESIKIEYMVKGIKKQHMQLMFQSFGNGDPQKLCDIILDAYGKKLKHVEKIAWRGQQSIKFPS